MHGNSPACSTSLDLAAKFGVHMSAIYTSGMVTQGRASNVRSMRRRAMVQLAAVTSAEWWHRLESYHHAGGKACDKPSLWLSHLAPSLLPAKASLSPTKGLCLAATLASASRLIAAYTQFHLLAYITLSRALVIRHPQQSPPLVLVSSIRLSFPRLPAISADPPARPCWLTDRLCTAVDSILEQVGVRQTRIHHAGTREV